MFRKRSEKEIRDIEDGERFARTAILTFVLVYLSYPVFLLVNAGTDTEPSEPSSGLVVLIWIFGLGFAAKMLFFAMIAGALSFFPIYRVLSKRIGRKTAATLSVAVSAYFAIFVSYHIGIDLFPFDISWNSELGAYAFSRSLGIFAAILSLPIAWIMWLGAEKDV